MLKHWNVISFRVAADNLHVHVPLERIAKGTISFYVHFITVINSQISQTVKRKGWNLQNNRAVYIFKYNNLCLIINILCCTAHNFTLRTEIMEHTETVWNIQVISRFVDITVGCDFVRLCDKIFHINKCLVLDGYGVMTAWNSE